jgi:hypothetical protein
MSAPTDHAHEGRDQTASPRPMHGGPGGLRTTRQRRRPFVKRSTDDRSVRDELDAAPTGGRLPPGITQNRTPEGLGRWGMRGMQDFSVEELAQLHQKLEGWIGQRAPQTERPGRRPWVMQPKTAHPA